jgi:hypothetical protein
VVFVSPFQVDLVLSGSQRLDPTFEYFVLLGQSEDLGFDPIPGARSDDLISSVTGGPQLLRDARALATTYEDFVVDKSFELTNRLFEVLLLLLFDLTLIEEHGLVERVTHEGFIHCDADVPAIYCR